MQGTKLRFFKTLVQVIDIFRNKNSTLRLKDVVPSVIRSAFGTKELATEFQVLDMFVANVNFSKLPMNFPDYLENEGGFCSKGLFQQDSIAYLGKLKVGL